MANNSKRNTNNSQWFITLDRADELTGRHTMFGRIQGPTYYSGYQELDWRADKQMSSTLATWRSTQRRNP